MENPKLENISEITTRVVLTEKAPFWVNVFFDNGDYFGTYAVKNCISLDELREDIEDDDDTDINDNTICDYYIITEGVGKNELLLKSRCKRIIK